MILGASQQLEPEQGVDVPGQHQTPEPADAWSLESVGINTIKCVAGPPASFSPSNAGLSAGQGGKQSLPHFGSSVSPVWIWFDRIFLLRIHLLSPSRKTI